METEASFQRRVTDLANENGWEWFHSPNMQLSNPGWPDLALLHPVWHRVAIWELKSAIGKPTLMQEMWIYTLQTVCDHIDSNFLRPSDWPLIEAYLTGRVISTRKAVEGHD